MSVSRTGTVGLLAVLIVLVPTWDRQRRREFLRVGILMVVALKLAAPGLLGTIRALFLSFFVDPSITSRRDDYAYVGEFIGQHPVFGRGYGTFLPESYDFLDNQYLLSLVETGIVGVVALVAVFARRLRPGDRDPSGFGRSCHAGPRAVVGRRSGRPAGDVRHVRLPQLPLGPGHRRPGRRLLRSALANRAVIVPGPANRRIGRGRTRRWHRRMSVAGTEHRVGAPDLVITGMPWIDAVRRGAYMPSDRLLLSVLADGRFERVLVANPYRSGPARAARRVLGSGDPPLPQGPDGRRQWTPTRLRRRDPRSVDALERAHQRYGIALGHRVGAERLRRPVVITADIFTAAFSDLSWAESITYFAWDDWAAHPAHRRWKEAHAVAEGRLRERGTRVVAVSRPIIDRLRPTGPALVVPNGVEEDEWTVPPSVVRWFDDLARPRLLYTGTLDERLDAHDLDEVAQRFSHGSLVLLGPAVSTGHLDRVLRRPNVHLRPPVGRDELVAVVRAAEVGLLPHRRAPLTEAMSPLKLYEYLAGGRPVAATDLPPVRGVHPTVELVAAGDSFADAVERARLRGPMPEAERAAFVAANAWSGRIEAVLGAALGDGR